MYALASLWRPVGSAPLCFYLAWQARDLLLCKGCDVRPGVPLASLGLRASVLLIGVAGAGLAALQGA